MNHELKMADVRISKSIAKGCLDVTTSDAAYDQVRNVLLSLQESMGLPVRLYSEGLENLEKHPKNEFTIAAWRIGRGDNLLGLATELKRIFEGFDLSVSVLLD